MAYANGANDVSKGIATLVGSGVTNYWRAILWCAAWTGLGGAVAAPVTGAMLATFGEGLLAAEVTPSFAASIAALAGAGAWVFIATRTCLPMSTTHALAGSVVGVGIAAYGTGGVAWSALGGKVAMPLLASSLVAFVLTWLMSRGLTFTFGPGRAAGNCVCVTAEPSTQLTWSAHGSAALVAAPVARLSVATGDAEGVGRRSRRRSASLPAICTGSRAARSVSRTA